MESWQHTGFQIPLKQLLQVDSFQFTSHLEKWLTGFHRWLQERKQAENDVWNMQLNNMTII